jgi:hypothetical protein
VRHPTATGRHLQLAEIEYPLRRNNIHPPGTAGPFAIHIAADLAVDTDNP